MSDRSAQSPRVADARPGAVSGKVVLRRSYLMGRPNHFAQLSARAGGPAESRPKLFRGKSDPEAAARQWSGLASLLASRGIDVLALQPDKNLPELAVASLAGFLPDRSARTFVGDKLFLVGAPVDKHRQEIQAGFNKAIRGIGLRIVDLRYRFGGGCDFFRCGKHYLFTPGVDDIEDAPEGAAQRFMSLLSKKPTEWSTDKRLREDLLQYAGGAEVLEFHLTDPRFPRGDMVLNGIGPDRNILVVYVQALHQDAQHLVLGRKNKVSDYLIPLSEHDAAMYAAGGIHLAPMKEGDRPAYIIPEGVTDDLLARIDRAGIEPIPVPFSEWIKKDRGGPVSLLCDLGYLRDDKRTQTPDVTQFRASLRNVVEAQLSG